MKISQNPPKSSKILQNPPKSSKILQNPPKSSKIHQTKPRCHLGAASFFGPRCRLFLFEDLAYFQPRCHLGAASFFGFSRANLGATSVPPRCRILFWTSVPPLFIRGSRLFSTSVPPRCRIFFWLFPGEPRCHLGATSVPHPFLDLGAASVYSRISPIFNLGATSVPH